MPNTKSRGFYASMLALAIPVALQNLLSSSAHLVDTAMVVGLGNVATAAVGVASRWTFLVNLSFFGICSGGAALISQFWGAKDRESIQKTYSVAFLCALTIGILYNIVAFTFPHAMMRVFSDEAPLIAAGAEYLRIVGFCGALTAFSLVTAVTLRSTEDVITPLISSATTVVVNTLFNYALIYGKFGLPALGIRGAAYATLISAIINLLLLFIIPKLRKSVVSFSFRRLFAIDTEIVQKFFRVALPVVVNEIVWAIGTNVYVMILARQGSENYAAYTVYSTIEQMAFTFFIGICAACSIMVGKNVGAGKLEEAYGLAKRFIRMTPVLGLVVGGLLALLRNPILSLLPIETEAAARTASALLLMYAAILPGLMLPFVCIVGTFRAGGDTKIGFYYDTITVYLMGIPLVALLGLVLHVPFVPLVAAMLLGENVVKTVLCIQHFRSRKWIKQLTLPGNNAPSGAATPPG